MPTVRMPCVVQDTRTAHNTHTHDTHTAYTHLQPLLQPICCRLLRLRSPAQQHWQRQSLRCTRRGVHNGPRVEVFAGSSVGSSGSAGLHWGRRCRCRTHCASCLYCLFSSISLPCAPSCATHAPSGSHSLLAFAHCEDCLPRGLAWGPRPGCCSSCSCGGVRYRFRRIGHGSSEWCVCLVTDTLCACMRSTCEGH